MEKSNIPENQTPQLIRTSLILTKKIEKTNYPLLRKTILTETNIYGHVGPFLSNRTMVTELHVISTVNKKKQYTHRQPSILDHLGPILVMLGKMELYHILVRMVL